MIKAIKRFFSRKVILVPMRPIGQWNEGLSRSLNDFLGTPTGLALIEQMEGAEAASQAWACNEAGKADWKMGVAKGRFLSRLQLLSLATIPKVKGKDEKEWHEMTEDEQNEILEERIANRVASGNHFIL